MRILRNIVAGALAVCGVLLVGEAAQARPMQPPALVSVVPAIAASGASTTSCHWRRAYHRRHWHNRRWRGHGYRGFYHTPRYYGWAPRRHWHRGWYGRPGWHHRWHRGPGWHRFY